jgi:hypothetical protein
MTGGWCLWLRNLRKSPLLASIYMSFEGFGFCKVDVVVGVAEPLRAKSWT